MCEGEGKIEREGERENISFEIHIKRWSIYISVEYSQLSFKFGLNSTPINGNVFYRFSSADAVSEFNLMHIFETSTT